MKCKLCEDNAINHVKWGKASQQEGNLCQFHIEELWNKVKGNVNEGINYWIQTEIK